MTLQILSLEIEKITSENHFVMLLWVVSIPLRLSVTSLLLFIYVSSHQSLSVDVLFFFLTLT